MTNSTSHAEFDLTPDERVYYRDRLRTARYVALADAEGFSEICFAVEALGMRLLKKQDSLAKYQSKIVRLSKRIPVVKTLAKNYPGCFTALHALYATLNKARNDAMHMGAYARHATSAAIELCIHLEEAVMTNEGTDSQGDFSSMKVQDFMVKEVVSLEDWHPIAYARKLMLMHSFSFLPVFLSGKNQWVLISELAVAKYLQMSLRADPLRTKKSKVDLKRDEKSRRLALPIHTAIDANDPKFPEEFEPQALELCDSPVELTGGEEIHGIFSRIDTSKPTLWLVLEKDMPCGEQRRRRLEGVLTPFELM